MKHAVISLLVIAVGAAVLLADAIGLVLAITFSLTTMSPAAEPPCGICEIESQTLCVPGLSHASRQRVRWSGEGIADVSERSRLPEPRCAASRLRLRAGDDGSWSATNF
jgi:hypothetical protein